MSNGRVICPNCHHIFDAPLAGRKTNNGFDNCAKLISFLTMNTVYFARAEPRTKALRHEGQGLRPDIKITRHLSAGRPPIVYVERQEQNTSGTGCEKIATKMQKAIEVLASDPNVAAYYIVIDGMRSDLLEKAAINAARGRAGFYNHERLHVVVQSDFVQLATDGHLETEGAQYCRVRQAITARS